MSVSDFKDAWKEYEADFNAMTDKEIDQEYNRAVDQLEEAESWIEAVDLWKAAGKPRKSEDE